MIFRHALGDEEPGAAARHEIAFGDEALIGLHRGDARDAVLGGELARGGHPRARFEAPCQHALAEEGDDLVLQRGAAAAVEGEAAPERRNGARHLIGSG